MNFPLEGNCKFLRAVNVSTLYVLLQGSSEVLALSTTPQETAVSTAAPCAARWRHLQWLWVCWRGHEKTSSHSVMDLLGDLHFPHGLSLGKGTAGTCFWQQILGNSNVTVVLLPALPVPEPWKVRSVPVSQSGVRGVGQHCRKREADCSSSSNHYPTPSVGAWTTSPNPARMPSSTPFAPLFRVGLGQPQPLTLGFGKVLHCLCCLEAWSLLSLPCFSFTGSLSMSVS